MYIYSLNCSCHHVSMKLENGMTRQAADMLDTEPVSFKKLLHHVRMKKLFNMVRSFKVCY